MFPHPPAALRAFLLWFLFIMNHPTNCMISKAANTTVDVAPSFQALVNVRFHLLSNSGQSPIQKQHLKAQMNQLNRAFSGSGFEFKFVGAIDYTRKRDEFGQEVRNSS